MEPSPPDRLSMLLRQWKPEPDGSTRQFVDETMRRLRAEPHPSRGNWVTAALERLAEEWLPAPGVLVPVTAALIVMLGVQYWAAASRQARTDAAIQWRAELSQPLSKMSLSGAYARLAKDSR